MTSPSPPRPSVLVISRHGLGGNLAGTSIRALELARTLTAHADVTLAGTGEPPSSCEGIPCLGYEAQHPSALRGAIAAADVIVTMPQWPPLMRLLRRAPGRIVYDLYVPEALETIGGFPGQRPLLRHAFTEYALDRCLEAMRHGDLMLCASEGQRDLYLGAMLAARLLPAARYAVDPSLRSLIDVVPFGLPESPAVPTGVGGPRTHIPGIGPNDEIVLWNGGIWPWLDPGTAIRAIAALQSERPDVHLVFMGTSNALPAVRATEAASAIASELGLLGRRVHFHDGWVPYDQRSDWLLEADCAFYAHHDHLETRFAFRTRLLDCFWARLPVACTTGDDLARQVEQAGAGAVFAPGDVDGAAAALTALLDAGRDAYADPLATLAARHRWDRVAAPLTAFVTGAATTPTSRAPRRAIRPGELGRRAFYVAMRRGLDLVGMRDRPRL